nr:potassium channel family protein [Gloeocapsa sp. PCC 7428]
MGYVLAGWSLLDAVYMSAITIFGVGYGEVRPITSPAHEFLQFWSLSQATRR